VLFEFGRKTQMTESLRLDDGWMPSIRRGPTVGGLLSLRR
jgi:hypothetical protein